MNFARLRTGDVLAALFGFLLLVVMTVLDWFAPSGLGENAWSSFVVTDVLLGVCALGGVLIAIFTAARGTPAWPLVITVWTMALCTLMVPVTLYRIVNSPGPDDVTEVSSGAWIGFVVLLALTYFVFKALRDERTPGLEPTPAPEQMPAPAAGRPDPSA